MIRRKFIKRFSFSLGVILGLFALTWAFENLHGHLVWKKCQRELEAKGEKLDWKEFVPPPVLDDQNFAMTPLLAPLFNYTFDDRGNIKRDTNALAKIRSIFVWPADIHARWETMESADMESLRTFLRGLTNEFGGTPVDGLEKERVEWRKSFRKNRAIAAWLSKNELPSPSQDLLALLREDGKELDELYSALDRSNSRFNIKYDEGIGRNLEHLAELKKLALTLRFKALAELNSENSNGALNDVLKTLALADTVKAEPFAVCGSVRLAIIQIAVQPVWEGLARHQWSEEQIITLQSVFSKLNLVEDMLTTLRRERAFEIREIEYQSQDWPKGWTRQNQAGYARTFQKFVIPCFDLTNRVVDVGLSRRCIEQIDVLRKESSNPYTFFAYVFASGPVQWANRTAEAQTVVNLVVIACALERYHFSQGEYPKQLNQLAPKFITTIPNDAFNGEPLKYKNTKDGRFLLYSIGLDLRDDGGTMPERLRRISPDDPTFHGWIHILPAKNDNVPERKPRDIVWQYPKE